MEGGEDHPAREALSGVYEIDLTDNEALLKVSDEYSMILTKYSLNHDQVDYDQYRIERSEVARKL